MRIWRWLISGCWFSHDYIRERDDLGQLILVCQDCGSVQRPQLEMKALDREGPAHKQAPILGTPKGKAVKAKWFERRKVS